MRDPGIGDSNLGAMVGVVVGSFAGLFAVAVADLIVNHQFRIIPKLTVISWLISAPFGWLIGGFIGRRLGFRLRSQTAEIVGGAIGGLIIPVLITIAASEIAQHYGG